MDCRVVNVPLTGPAFGLKLHREGEVGVVGVQGEIDLVTSPYLGQALNEVRRRNILMDLTGAEFIDSSGVSVLCQSHYRQRQDGRELTLLCDTGPVLNALKLFGAHRLLQIVSPAPAMNGDGVASASAAQR